MTKTSTMRAVSIEDIKQASLKGDKFFFTPDVMRFFRSRVGEYGYASEDRRLVYFVTSEQGPSGPRAWTVRVIDMQTGSIDDASPFMHYTSGNGARYAARALAGCPRYWDSNR